MAITDLIQRIVVDTAYGPTIDVDMTSSEPGVGSEIMKILKPKITVYVAGLNPVVVTPYGDPGPSKWPIIEAVLVGLGAFGAFMVVRALTATKRR